MSVEPVQGQHDRLALDLLERPAFKGREGRGAVSAEALLSAADDRNRLNHCLGELDERTQTVIRTAFFEGVTYEALARRMDQPLGTVKSWIRRGLAKLKGCLEQ